MAHVSELRKQHPDKTYKQILSLAKQTYRQSTEGGACCPAPPMEDGCDEVAFVEGGAIIERNWNDKAKRILDGYGNWQIVSIRVQRAPVQEFVTGLLNTVTIGGYKAAMKSAGFDKMFHLGHVLTLRRDDGATKKVILEKNEVVNLSDSIPKEKDMEYIDVPIPSPFKTLNEYVDATLKAIGSGAFFLYDAKNRNCQRFIMDNLKSNGINTPQVETFVQQDADSIFKRLPGLQQFARTLTDLGAAVAHVKDEVIDTAQDVAKGAKIAARATAKQAKKVGRKIRKAFGGGLEEGRTLHTVLVPRSEGLAAARAKMRELGIPMPHGHRLQKNFYRFRQIPPEQFDQESFITMRLTEAPEVQVILGRLLPEGGAAC